MGECELVDCIGPLDASTFNSNVDNHCSATPFSKQQYKNLFAWKLKSAKRYLSPKPYTHPQGAIIWVKLSK